MDPARAPGGTGIPRACPARLRARPPRPLDDGGDGIDAGIKKIRGQYDLAFVYTETDANDTTYFLLNQLKVLRLAIDELFVYLKKKAQELREVERGLRGRDDLNNRQLAVLSYVLRNQDDRISIEGHQTSHRVSYQTARTDLLGLVERGYLEQTKVGKKLYFVPVPDIQRRLKTPA